MAGATLDCRSATGRAVLGGGGVAAVRPEPVAAAGTFIAPGGAAAVRLPLGPGRWQLQSSYVSRLPIEVTAPGFRATLPPSLDRPGPRWPVGRLSVRGRAPTVVTFSVDDPLLSPQVAFVELGTTVATRVAPVEIVPVRRACGRYVDWYRGARG